MVPLTALGFLISATAIGLFSLPHGRGEASARSYRPAVLSLTSVLIVLVGFDSVDYLVGWGLNLDWLGLDPMRVVGESSF